MNSKAFEIFRTKIKLSNFIKIEWNSSWIHGVGVCIKLEYHFSMKRQSKYKKSFRLCLVSEKFEGKCEGKKIQRKSRRKEKVKENKKID